MGTSRALSLPPKHQTSWGEWTTRYYVRFKDWKGVNRKFPAGTDLRAARQKKQALLGDNVKGVDFDRGKVEGMTFSRWADVYLEKYAAEKRSCKRDELSCRNLKVFFGPLLLSQVTRGKVEEYKLARKESATNRNAPRSKATINRELACLKHMLKLAAEEGLVDHVPAVKLYREMNARERALSVEEYERLLSASPRHLRRIIICAYETGMRAGEIKGLPWPKVDLKADFIRLAAGDTKAGEKRVIPIPPALREVFEEVRREQREGKVAPIDGRVFTWGGRPMTEGWKRAWRTACRKAGLEGLWFHDLRHTFVTRKVKEGWDYKRIMAITGHKTFATFMKYNNPREEDLKEVVANPSQPWQDRDNSVVKLLANRRKPQ